MRRAVLESTVHRRGRRKDVHTRVQRHVGLTPPALSPWTLSPAPKSFASTPILPPGKLNCTGAVLDTWATQEA
jgi:hypothetical protein